MAGLLDFLSSDLAGDIGLGLLAQSGPVVGAPAPSLGQAFGNAMLGADRREFDRLRLQDMRASLEDRKRQREAMTRLPELLQQTTRIQAPGNEVTGMGGESLGMIPGNVADVPLTATPEGQQQLMGLLGQIAPGELAGGLLGQMMRVNEPERFSGELGQLLENRDIAVRRGDPESARIFEQQIAASLQNSNVNFDDLNKVRNDAVSNSQGFLASQEGFENVKIGASAGTPAGDIQTVFGFMKVVDPNSVVREGEFATAENAAGIPERIRGMYNKLLTGERLTPEQRQDFLNRAAAQFKTRVDQQNKVIESTRSFAKNNGLPVEDVVPSYIIPNEIIIPDVTAGSGPAAEKAGNQMQKLGDDIGLPQLGRKINELFGPGGIIDLGNGASLQVDE